MKKKNLIFIIANLLIVLGIAGAVLYQFYAAKPIFLTHQNEEVKFEYPRWTPAGGDALLKVENSFHQAGVEVSRIEGNNLPLSYYYGGIKDEIGKDRTVAAEKVESGTAELELSGPSAKGEIKIRALIRSAGSGIYVFSAYSTTAKYQKNEATINMFFDSIEVKKEPLLSKIDLEGIVIKISGGEILAFSNKGEELYISLAEGAKLYDAKGEIQLSDVKQNTRFAAEGEFVPGSTLNFKAVKIIFY